MSSHDFHSVLTAPKPAREAPRRLDLSVDPSDGSLLVAPLTQVLLASTDALYSDLYNMAHGELEVVTTAAGTSQTGGPSDDQEPSETAVDDAHTKKSDRLSNLSFAQRRHELAWRLFQHTRGLGHVAALTASNASTKLAASVRLCSRTLQHVHSHWRQADEAQDALYFHHGQLFAARAPPQDILAACDVLLTGKWYDLPSNLRLTSAAYLPEMTWSRKQLQQEWELAVRKKLALGEVGWRRKQELVKEHSDGGSAKTLWKLVVRGGIVKLLCGKPKRMNAYSDKDTDEQLCYPISAILTVFSTGSRDSSKVELKDATPLWTLLSLDVHVRAKTGEFSHQLEASQRQRYDLHRLAARAMLKEEMDYQQRCDEQHMDGSSSSDRCGTQTYGTISPARPLQALFHVAHTFSLSWQLELLSAQAQALRRGAWGAVASTSNAIHVSPVQFHDAGTASDECDSELGVVIVHFWKVDDAYGRPSLGELTKHATKIEDRSSLTRLDSAGRSQLALVISAEVNLGVRVTLSGGHAMMEPGSEASTLRQVAIMEIIESTSNPLELSVSSALLAATKLCALQRCKAVVEALQPSTGNRILPNWMRLQAHRGIVSVAARVDYHGIEDMEDHDRSHRNPCVLFRLECDLRTGSFVPTFSRQTELLSELACNSESTSEAMSVRIASLPTNRRRAAAASSSGRAVKTIFDGLVRSMNILGERVGVGGSWDDLDDKSGILRERAIQAAATDVKLSLVKCCGAAALYGLTPVAVGIGPGIEAVPDIAGGPIDNLDGISFLPTPPLSFLLDQEIIEVQTKIDALTKKSVHLQQRLFAFSVSASESCLKVAPLSISMKLTAPSDVPVRESVNLSTFKGDQQLHRSEDFTPPTKRAKLTKAGDGIPLTDNRNSMLAMRDLMDEATIFAGILCDSVGDDD